MSNQGREPRDLWTDVKATTPADLWHRGKPDCYIRVYLAADVDAARAADAASLSAREQELIDASRALDEVVAPDPSKPLVQRIRDEFADFQMLVDHCSEIYDHVTHGRISKPNTLPREVKAVADNLVTELVAEETQELRDELSAREQEIQRAMAVLQPNMPESGLEDACRQVKQAAISASGNCNDLELLVADIQIELAYRTKELAAADHHCRFIQAERDALQQQLSQAQETIKSLMAASVAGQQK